MEKLNIYDVSTGWEIEDGIYEKRRSSIVYLYLAALYAQTSMRVDCLRKDIINESGVLDSDQARYWDYSRRWWLSVGRQYVLAELDTVGPERLHEYDAAIAQNIVVMAILRQANNRLCDYL